MGYVGLLLLALLGILMFCKPQLLWKIEHIWSVKSGEPTDFYLSSMRFLGVVFAVAAVIIGIYSLC